MGASSRNYRKSQPRQFKKVETLLQGAGLLIKVYDAWKHVKIAAIAGCKPGGSQDAPGVNTQAQDIKDIKIELKELSKIVLGLVK